VYKRTWKNGCLGDIPNGSPENKKHNESMKSYKLEGLLPKTFRGTNCDFILSMVSSPLNVLLFLPYILATSLVGVQCFAS